jgi:hypothetical protein
MNDWIGLLAGLKDDKAKMSAVQEAVRLLVSSGEFVLVHVGEANEDPEVFGFGKPSESVVEGLKMAHQYMQGELEKFQRETDVQKLVDHISKN